MYRMCLVIHTVFHLPKSPLGHFYGAIVILFFLLSAPHFPSKEKRDMLTAHRQLLQTQALPFWAATLPID